MNRKVLITLPLAVSCLALFSCGGEKVSKVSATVPSTNIYKRGGTISKDDITVTADTNNGSKIVASKDWTSDKFGSNTTYTFIASGENTIDIKYGGQSCDVKVTVYPKGSTDFTFKDISETEPLKIKVNETKTVEITMKEEGAEVDISKVDWSIDEGSSDPDAIQITPDVTNKFKCEFKGLKEGAVSINVKATDTVGNYKTNTLLVEVEEDATNIIAEYDSGAWAYLTADYLGSAKTGDKFKCTINYDSSHNIKTIMFRNSANPYDDVGYKDQTGDKSINITSVYDDDKNDISATESGGVISLDTACSKKIYVNFIIQKDLPSATIRFLAQQQF